VAVDLPGFGLSQSPEINGDLLSVYDRFVAEAVCRYAEEQDAPVVLAGNSLGGSFTMRAGMDDLPLAGIVPIAPAGPHLAPWLRTVAQRIPTALLNSSRLRSRGLPPRLTRQLLTTAYRRVAHASRDTVDHEIIGLYLRHQGDGTAMLER